MITLVMYITRKNLKHKIRFTIVTLLLNYGARKKYIKLISIVIFEFLCTTYEHIILSYCG